MPPVTYQREKQKRSQLKTSYTWIWYESLTKRSNRVFNHTRLTDRWPYGSFIKKTPNRGLQEWNKTEFRICRLLSVKKGKKHWCNQVKAKIWKIMANCFLDHNFQDLANFQHPMGQDRSVFQGAQLHCCCYRSSSAIQNPEVAGF